MQNALRQLRFGGLAAAAVALALGVAPAASARDEPAPATAPDEPSVSYTVGLTVADTDKESAPADLRGRLEQASRLRALSGEPPATRIGLRRRLEADVQAFRDVLRGEGFYAGDVEGRINDDSAGAPVQVALSVTPGPRYTVTASEVVYRDAAPGGDRPASLAAVGLPDGEPARADAVLTAERDLIRHLRAAGYPFAEAVGRRVLVNHADRSMAVRVEVAAGPPATFGAVRYQGLERTKRDYIDAQVPWRSGARFDDTQVEQFRTRLLASRLFTAVTVKPDGRPGPGGRLPVLVEVEEAPPRSIGGGLRYATDDGPGARVFWEHRNLLGRAEHLRANLDASLLSQSAELIFRKPRFWHPDQSLRLEAFAERSAREAYEGYTARLGAGLDRKLSETWRMAGGVSLEGASLDDHGETETSFLLGLPVEAVRDDTDDPLDPTEGSRLSLGVTPFGGQADGMVLGFAVADISGSTYWSPIPDSNRLVLAARARAASLLGAGRDEVPPNHRLFAGGGGSVRGYGHQMIGPLDDDDAPLGGRSALEVGVEARIRVTDTIGIVPFIDGGLIGDDPVPDFERPIRWAAGLGVRYHTDFGPLRADIAVPLNKRDADNWFQLYVSLGQAF